VFLDTLLLHDIFTHIWLFTVHNSCSDYLKSSCDKHIRKCPEGDKTLKCPWRIF